LINSQFYNNKTLTKPDILAKLGIKESMKRTAVKLYMTSTSQRMFHVCDNKNTLLSESRKTCLCIQAEGRNIFVAISLDWNYSSDTCPASENHSDSRPNPTT